jgi:hypothetical protein
MSDADDGAAVQQRHQKKKRKLAASQLSVAAECAAPPLDAGARLASFAGDGLNQHSHKKQKAPTASEIERHTATVSGIMSSQVH